ncbi:MAG: RNA polymerase sigma factor [Acidobacteriota bacterium]
MIKGTKGKGRRSRSAPPVSGDLLEKLVAEVKRGDADAFRQLYGLYGRKILNYIYRMTGSRGDAEDLTQDTFILAYKKIDSLKESRKFQSWLFRIAQNNVYQKFRTKRPHFEPIVPEAGPQAADVHQLASPLKSPEAHILSDELQGMLQQVINELPNKYREVFVLAALHKLSYQEISTMVGRSLPSVKSDIHRARVAVRDKIKRYLGNNYGMSNLF